MALCQPELSGWAGRIYDNLPDQSNNSTGKIVGYFQNNLYKLNSLIYTDFYLDASGCINPDLTPMQSGIYESLYYCNWLKFQAAQNLGAAAFSFVEIESHDQGRLRKASRTTIADSYRQEAKICDESLQDLIDFYNGSSSPAVGMVLYDCRGRNSPMLPDYGYMPCWEYFRNCNSVFCNL